MSDNLAQLSLGYTSANKVSLTERRANYEAWLASNKRIPMGNGNARTDEKPTLQALASKRAAAEAEAKSHLINPIGPDAVVRTDQGDNDANPSDEVRLGLAKVLLSKAEGSDAATAERLANATSALLKPIIRVDDDKGGKDADLKNKVTGQGDPKRGSSPGAATAAKDDEDEEEPDKDKAKPRKVSEDNEDVKEPTLAEVMAALGKLNKRLDNIEEKKEDDDDDSGSEDLPERGAPLEKNQGTPRSLAADSELANHKKAMRWRQRQDEIGEVLCRPDTSDLFLTFQARADKAYAVWGQRAEAPLHGQTLIAYRRKLLQPLQKYSQAFRLADLRVVAVDAAAFKTAENDIYDSAIAAGTRNDNVPIGFLREVTENRGGHQYTKFYGRPLAWMAPMMIPGKRVKQITKHADSNGPERILYNR